jgi:putative lipoprotein
MRAITLTLLFALVACQSVTAEKHTSSNSLDWAGVYQGVLPCADCEGIETTLKLTADQTYELSRTYLGSSTATLTATGSFEWRQDGRAIMLNTSSDTPQFFRVEENRLRQLDTRGEPIRSALGELYVLRKVDVSTISKLARLAGTATYRERMALPAMAVFEATLEDVSRADTPAEVLGRSRIGSPAQPPIHFTITYDASRIDPTHRYVVRARILAHDDVLFMTDSSHPVLTAGGPAEANLLLKRAAASAASASRTTATLENTYWKLTHLGATAVAVVAHQPEPHFMLHQDVKRVSGSGGCNRLTGTYELEGHRLAFSGLAGTMMACPSGMDDERSFHEALLRTATWRLEGEQLELFDASGVRLARFESRYMR